MNEASVIDRRREQVRAATRTAMDALNLWGRLRDELDAELKGQPHGAELEQFALAAHRVCQKLTTAVCAMPDYAWVEALMPEVVSPVDFFPSEDPRAVPA